MRTRIVEKGWGREEVVCNGPAYCGKVLVFRKGAKCSFHWHRVKDEHFYLESGSILLRYGRTDDLSQAESLLLLPGDVFHVTPGLRHQMKALTDSRLFEFSTEHREEDVVRVVKGD